MSEKYIQTPFCDDHPDDIAQAFCKCHMKLLCLSCVLEKAKSSECSFTEIRKVFGEQDIALYEGLLVRQIAINKKRPIEALEKKTEELKNTLKKEITDFHEQLMTSLNKTKNDCLALLENHADRIIAQNKYSKAKLETFEKIISENVEKLSAQSSSDLIEIQTKLDEVKQALLTEVPDAETNLEGYFEADKCLKDTVSKTGFVLGRVCLLSQSHYAQVENETDINVESNVEAVADIKETKDFVNKKESAYLSSDEASYKTTVTEKGIQSTEKPVAAEDSSKKPQDIVSGKQGQEAFNGKEIKKNQKAQNVKENKKRVGLFGLFHKRKSDSEQQGNDIESETKLQDIKDSPAKLTAAQNLTEDIYQVTTLHTQEYNQLRNSINKTVPIGGAQKLSSPLLRFRN